MAKKRKEKIQFIEKVQFQELEHAKRVVTLAKINQIRILIGLVFALVATGFTAFGLWGDVADPVEQFCYAGFLAVPAYLIGGGIGRALKSAWKITQIGWFLIPIFPVDILVAIAFFFASLFGFFFIPVIFVGLNFLQHKRTLDAAKA